MEDSHCPDIICWRITSSCNRCCPFCFRPEIKELPTSKIFKIIDVLSKNNVRGIGITGGEPLLRKNIDKIIKYLHKKNIKICLATNGDFYNKHRKTVSQYVSTIGLPIEGSKKEIHDSIRGKGSFKNIIFAANNIYKQNKVGLYFSTVLSQKNIEDLTNIETLLKKYKERIVYWKIYETIEYDNRPFQSLKKHGIKNKNAINNTIKLLGKELGRNKIFYLSSKKRSSASIIINPNGNIILPTQEKTKTEDINIGNLLKDNPEIVFKNLDGLINKKKYHCHICALKLKKRTDL